MNPAPGNPAPGNPAPGNNPVIDVALLHRMLTVGPVRDATPGEIQRLIRAGCEIEPHPQHGATLARSGLGAWEDYLRWACPLPRGSVRTIHVYRTTASTQDAARRLGQHGAIAIADEQTAGRGRLGRRWLAPPGKAVTFSYAAVLQKVTIDRLSLAAAVAVARALESIAKPQALRIGIKWPNDVVISGRKIAGILVELFPVAGGQLAVIGVGINTGVEPADLPGLADRVTSLHTEHVLADRLLVLAEVVRRMDAALSLDDPAELLDEWRTRCVNLSQRLTLSQDGRIIRGTVIDLDPAEGLVVRTDEGQIVVLPGATTTVVV